MHEQDSNAIKLQIWESIMRRVQRFYPTSGVGFIGGQVYPAGSQQYSSETPCVQPLDAAKQVQAVFDALYPPTLTVTVSGATPALRKRPAKKRSLARRRLM